LFNILAKLLFTLPLSLALTSCEAEPIATSLRSAARGKGFAVTRVGTMVTPAGSVLELNGLNFNQALRVLRIKPHGEGAPVLSNIALTLQSSNVATVNLPSQLPYGRYDLELKQNGQMQLITLFSTGMKNEFPIFTGSADQICQGESFYDSSGELHQGARQCGNVTMESCSQDGQSGCIATTSHPAASIEAFKPNVLRSGTTIAGIAGVLGNCSVEGANECVVTGNFAAADITAISNKVLAGTSVAGVSGNVLLPSPSNVRIANGPFVPNSARIAPSLVDCALDGEAECYVNAAIHRAASVGQAIPANIRQGVVVAGVAGAHVGEIHSECTTDGAVGCVATSSYAAASTANLADRILSGSTVAGMAGRVTLPNSADVLSGTTFGAEGIITGRLTLPDAAMVRVSNGPFGSNGTGSTPTLGDCSADGKMGCVSTASYPAALAAGLDQKILTGEIVAGVSGTVSLPANNRVLAGTLYGPSSNLSNGTLTLPDEDQVRIGSGPYGIDGTGSAPTLGDCSADGGMGCVAVGPLYAAATTTGLAAKVLSGQVVAGVNGSATSESHSSCTSDGAINCVSVAAFRAAATANLASKVLSGETVAGTGGNVVLPAPSHVYSGTIYGVGGTSASGILTIPAAANVRVVSGSYGVGGNGTIPNLADCSADGAVGCVTTASYKSANTSTAIAGNIKSGVVVAGVTGDFAPGCATDGQTNCLANDLFKAANISGISTWDLRIGKTLGGVNGALKTNCRNGVTSSKFNYDGAVASLGTTAVTTGTALDYWDTVEDYYGSPSKVTAWAASTLCDAANWSDATTTNGGTSYTTCAAATANCQYKDNVSNLVLTKTIATAQTWPSAIRACAISTYGGFPAGTWRLPTQKELMDIYNHGIVYAQNVSYMDLTAMQNWFWSSSTVGSSATGTDAWYVYLATGDANWNNKANAANVLCVK